MGITYIHTLEYSIKFDSDSNTITASHSDFGIISCLHLDAIRPEGCNIIKADDMIFSKAVRISASRFDIRFLFDEKTLTLSLIANQSGISVFANGDNGISATLFLSGTVGTADDPINDGFSTCIDRHGIGLRSAIGPATSYGDNAIFDRARGVAVIISNKRNGSTPKGLTLGFDFEKNSYTLNLIDNSLYMTVKSDIFYDMLGIHYKAINKKTAFPVPHAGWMTWYAVQFDASEQVILENANIMKKRLYDFGANTIWVDWEWQHEELSKEGPCDVDVFTPFHDRYPNGLAHLSRRISEMGLIPALWVGFTHEPGHTKFIDEHPETVLSDHIHWYGRYTFDPSHPVWREKYLIPAAKNTLQLGYSAIKWDCLPTALSTCDKYFDKMYGTQGPWRAMHEAVKTVRDVLGKDFYMMSCSGGSDRSVLFAADIFDGARIGEDVFTWEAFKNTANRLCHLYSLHNTVLYCDPDNIIIRDEYNANALEKRARISLISLLGLPITIGDDLRSLSDEDLEYYKRALPAIDAHPCDIRDYHMENKVLSVRLAVLKSFTRFYTVGVFNFADKEQNVELTFRDDLGLIGDEFHIYDIFNAQYRGIESEMIKLTLSPHECCVLRITPTNEYPTVIATSRHITGGVPDLLDISYKDNKLIGKSSVVAGDKYTVTIYDPEKKDISCITIIPEHTGEITWTY